MKSKCRNLPAQRTECARHKPLIVGFTTRKTTSDIKLSQPSPYHGELKLFRLLGVLFVCLQAAHSESREPIDITVDLTDAPRKILHAHLRFPVQPGALTLYYPQ